MPRHGQKRYALYGLGTKRWDTLLLRGRGKTAELVGLAGLPFALARPWFPVVRPRKSGTPRWRVLPVPQSRNSNCARASGSACAALLPPAFGAASACGSAHAGHHHGIKTTQWIAGSIHHRQPQDDEILGRAAEVLIAETRRRMAMCRSRVQQFQVVDVPRMNSKSFSRNRNSEIKGATVPGLAGMEAMQPLEDDIRFLFASPKRTSTSVVGAVL